MSQRDNSTLHPRLSRGVALPSSMERFVLAMDQIAFGHGAFLFLHGAFSLRSCWGSETPILGRSNPHAGEIADLRRGEALPMRSEHEVRPVAAPCAAADQLSTSMPFMASCSFIVVFLSCLGSTPTVGKTASVTTPARFAHLNLRHVAFPRFTAGGSFLQTSSAEGSYKSLCAFVPPCLCVKTISTIFSQL